MIILLHIKKKIKNKSSKETIYNTEVKNDLEKTEASQYDLQTQGEKVNLEKGEKIVEPIFLDRRIEE